MVTLCGKNAFPVPSILLVGHVLASVIDSSTYAARLWALENDDK